MYDTKFTAAIATVRDRILADQITSGDVVLHHGSQILVISEPEYTIAGIVFDGLWLSVESPDNTQQFCFDPDLLVELISYNPTIKSLLAA